MLFKGLLKKKISEAEATGKPLAKSPKRNKIGKQGINKKDHYEYIPFDLKKTCILVITLIILLLITTRVKRRLL